MEKPELNVVECEGARSVAVSPDGKMICLARAGGGNGAAIVQTNSTFQCELEGTLMTAVAGVAWASGDGLRVAAGGKSTSAPNALQPSGGYVLVCEPERGARVFATQTVAPVTCLSMSVDDGGSRIACGRSDGIVEVIDAFTGDPLSKARLRGYESRFNHRAPFAGMVPDIPLPPRSGAPPMPIASVCWHCDGQRVGVAHATHATVLDLRLVQLPSYLDMMPNETIAPQGSALEDDMADDTQAIVTQTQLGCGSQVACVALSPDGTDPPLLAFCGGARVSICNSEDGLSVAERRLDDFKGSGNDWRAALSVAFCPAHAQTGAVKPGQLQLVVGGELATGPQGAVAVFDAVAGTILSVHQARSPVVCVGVAADGRSMALGERRLDPPPATPPSPFLQQPAGAPAPNPFATGSGATGLGAAPAPAPTDRGPALFVFGAGNEATRIAPPPVEEKPEDRASRFGRLSQPRRSLDHPRYHDGPAPTEAQGCRC